MCKYIVLAKFFNSNPEMSVICNALESSPNNAIMKKVSKYQLAAPLFTIDFEKAQVSDSAFKKFFDTLAPAFGFQVSLGQINTTLLCPAFTSHSELDQEALLKSGIHKNEFYSNLWNEVKQNNSYTAVFANKTKDGILYYCEQTIIPISDTDEQYYLVVGTDISTSIVDELKRHHQFL